MAPVNSLSLDAPPPIAPNPPRQIIAATGVVRDGDRVLLVRHRRRGWEHAGGHVEPGEDVISALVREVREETGCLVQVDRLLAVYSFCDRPYYLMLVFACTYLSGEPQRSNEHEDVAWFPAATARDLITPPPEHAPQSDFFRDDGGPIYRAYCRGVEIVTHDGSAPSQPPLPFDNGERLLDEAPRQIVATSGCVRDDNGRVLLVRSGWRGWEFPGGQVEQGEDLISGVQREIEEESGVSVLVGAISGVYCNIGEPYVLQVSFACRYVGGELTPSDETPEVAWFTPKEAIALPLRAAFRARLLDALSPDPGVAYRVYRTRPQYENISFRRV